VSNTNSVNFRIFLIYYRPHTKQNKSKKSTDEFTVLPPYPNILCVTVTQEFFFKMRHPFRNNKSQVYALSKSHTTLGFISLFTATCFGLIAITAETCSRE